MALFPASSMGGVETPTTQPTNLTGGAGTIYVQKSGHVVQIDISGLFKNLDNVYTNGKLCTLPNGYIPNINTYQEGISYGSTPSGKSYKYSILLQTNGSVFCAIYGTDSQTVGTQDVFLESNITFLTN